MQFTHTVIFTLFIKHSFLSLHQRITLLTGWKVTIKLTSKLDELPIHTESMKLSKFPEIKFYVFGCGNILNLHLQKFYLNKTDESCGFLHMFKKLLLLSKFESMAQFMVCYWTMCNTQIYNSENLERNQIKNVCYIV